MAGRFGGKVAIVTGAASGIGAAIARGLAADGAVVVGVDIDENRLHNVERRIEIAGGRLIPVIADVTDPAAVEAFVAETVERRGGLHLAVNNAGIGGRRGLAHEIGLDDWQRVIDVDLNSVFYGVKYEGAAMVASGGGSIVNVSSFLGLVGEADAVAYTAAKHGVTGLTKAAAAGYAPHGIRVNSVHPGLGRHGAADAHRARRPRGAEAPQPARSPREAGGGRRGRAVPPVRRGVVRDGRAVHGRRRLHRDLTARHRAGRARCARRNSRSASLAVRTSASS